MKGQFKELKVANRNVEVPSDGCLSYHWCDYHKMLSSPLILLQILHFTTLHLLPEHNKCSSNFQFPAKLQDFP